MLAEVHELRRCPHCGQNKPTDDLAPPIIEPRPWHIRGRSDVKKYVKSLSEETREWLLALFVDRQSQLLAVETVARGDIGSCPVPALKIIARAHAVKARGIVLVHNHPSGDPTPSHSDVETTVRLQQITAGLDIPLVDHLIIAGDKMSSVNMYIGNIAHFDTW